MRVKDMLVSANKFIIENDILDLIAAIGIPTTIIVADGVHSDLHVNLAIVNEIFCVSTICLPKRLSKNYKWIPFFGILVVLTIAYFTGGLW